MMVSQAGTGSGTSGPGGPQDLGGALRRQRHERSTPATAAIPGVDAARRACRRSRRTARSCRPTARRAEGRHAVADRPLAPRRHACAPPGLDWVLMLAVARPGRARHACWSGRPPRTATTSPAATPRRTCKQAAGQRRHRRWCCWSMVMATDHRWVRILAPLVYLASIGRPGAGARRWARRSTARARGSSSAGCRSSRRSSPSSRW